MGRDVGTACGFLGTGVASAAMSITDGPQGRGCYGFCQGARVRLIWLFIQLLINLFPRASAAESGEGLGQRPKAPLGFGWFGVSKRLLFDAAGSNGFLLQRILLSAEGANVRLHSFTQFDHSCQEEERAAQSTYRGFLPSHGSELAPFQSFLVLNQNLLPPFRVTLPP